MSPVVLLIPMGVGYVLLHAVVLYALRESDLSGAEFVKAELHRIRRRFDLAAIRAQARADAFEMRRQILREMDELDEREGERF